MEQTIAVERTVWIAAPRERVWKAVTTPEQLEQWFATSCPWEIPTLQVGATVKFYNTPDDILLATITVLDPLRQFTLRWQSETPAAQITTFTLAEESGGTRVTVTETGFERLPDDIRQGMIDQTAEGYRMSMENLRAYVEGRSIPF